MSSSAPPDWRQEFLSCLVSPRASALKIPQALAIKGRNLPLKLYKYREFNPYSVMNFETDTVWLTSPIHQNDVFDSSFHVSADDLNRASSKLTLERVIPDSGLKKFLTPEDLECIQKSEEPIIESARILLERSHPGETEKNQKFVNFLIRNSREVVNKMVGQMALHQQKNLRTCSFSEVLDSNKLWGVYAKSHTGFCLEYSLDSLAPDDIRRTLLYPVIYGPRKFDATPYFLEGLHSKSFNNLFGILAAIHKTEEWFDEREWRFVAAMGSSFPEQNYPMPRPTAIFCGLKISNESKEQLCSIAKKKKVPIYQMHLSDSSLGLEHVQIN